MAAGARFHSGKTKRCCVVNFMIFNSSLPVNSNPATESTLSQQVCGKGRDAGAFSRQEITSVALRASSSNGHSFTSLKHLLITRRRSRRTSDHLVRSSKTIITVNKSTAHLIWYGTVRTTTTPDPYYYYYHSILLFIYIL